LSNGVEIYQFPTDDETVADINTSMNVSACMYPCSTDRVPLYCTLLR